MLSIMKIINPIIAGLAGLIGVSGLAGVVPPGMDAPPSDIWGLVSAVVVAVIALIREIIARKNQGK